MKPLIEYCKGAVNALTAQYEMTNVLKHSATSGSARESLILDFLTAHLPEMTSVVSGMIVDSEGRRSKQQDIVLMLKSMPRLPFASGHDLIFQEGTVATFEIKTEINPSMLEAIGSNIQSVKELLPSTHEGTCMGDLSWPHDRILTTVLTYRGAALNTIERTLIGMAPACQPDVYLDLSKGILIKNEGILFPKNGETPYLYFEDPAVGLARLLALLSKVTGRLALKGLDWEKYISE